MSQRGGRASKAAGAGKAVADVPAETMERNARLRASVFEWSDAAKDDDWRELTEDERAFARRLVAQHLVEMDRQREGKGTPSLLGKSTSPARQSKKPARTTRRR